MEPSTTQTATNVSTATVPEAESSHKKMYMIVGGVFLTLLIIGAFVLMYIWQQSLYTTKVNEMTAEKSLLTEEISSLKDDLVEEKEMSERRVKELQALTPVNPTEEELLAFVKRIVMYKQAISATSSIEMKVVQKTEAGDVYLIALAIDCKEGPTEDEQQACTQNHKAYKRDNNTWMILHANEACPKDVESVALCTKAGF